jgi:hypothetical protein
MRDIPVIARLDEIIQPMLRNPDRRIVILSSFMGMMPYHLTRKYGTDRLHFLDTCGITERSFTSCPLTATRPRSQFGLNMPATFVLERLDLLDAEAECAVPPPDIVVEAFWSQERLEALAPLGYEVVYTQESLAGFGLEPGRLGSITWNKLYVAVRRSGSKGRSVCRGENKHRTSRFNPDP